MYGGDDRSSWPIIKMQGQKLKFNRNPSGKVVSRALSSKASDMASELGSVAGSENSHSSQAPAAYKSMTLLFSNIPDEARSLTKDAVIKQDLQDFAKKVLDDPSFVVASPVCPVPSENFSWSASFSTPKKAPPGGCWLSFKYKVDGWKVFPGDGKAYSEQAFKKLCKGKEKDDLISEMFNNFKQDKKIFIDGATYTLRGLKDLYESQDKDAVILDFWKQSKDAAHELEKKLGGEDGAITIARWFINRVKAKRTPPHPGFENTSRTWADLKVGGATLSIEFKRGGK